MTVEEKLGRYKSSIFYVTDTYYPTINVVGRFCGGGRVYTAIKTFIACP